MSARSIRRSVLTRSDKKVTQFTDPEPAEPPQRRYFTNDSTYEKLCEILRDNPQGTLLHRMRLSRY